MRSATLHARLGVTAATLITAFTLVSSGTALASGSTLARTTSSTLNTASHSGGKLGVTKTRKAKSRPSIYALHARKVREVLREARRQKGKPYVYGADGPHAFDCSGLVRYVFLHSVHMSLPHNAAAQYHSLRHIPRRDLEPGDLIFTDNGYISHVGIFDGHHHWWVAPHTGTHVQRQRIYHAHFVYARPLVLHKHPPHRTHHHKHRIHRHRVHSKHRS